MTVHTMMHLQSMYMTPSMCLLTVATLTPTATRMQSKIMRTPYVCTVSTGTDAPTGVSIPTSCGIWHTGTSYSGIPYGTVATISTGISTHLIIMTRGTIPHGTTTPGSIIPLGIMTPGTMIPGTTIHITTVHTTHTTSMSAPVSDVTGDWYHA